MIQPEKQDPPDACHPMLRVHSMKNSRVDLPVIFNLHNLLLPAATTPKMEAAKACLHSLSEPQGRWASARDLQIASSTQRTTSQWHGFIENDPCCQPFKSILNCCMDLISAVTAWSLMPSLEQLRVYCSWKNWWNLLSLGETGLCLQRFSRWPCGYEDPLQSFAEWNRSRS